MPVHSKYVPASRVGAPPHTPVPGVPSGAPLSQRMPALSGVPSPLSQSETEPLIGATSSPEAPLRCSAYGRPPVYGPEVGWGAMPDRVARPAGSGVNEVRSVLLTHAALAAL